MHIATDPSINFDSRKDGKKIRHLIFHYTDTKTVSEALQLLQGKNPDVKVSAHYLIDERGNVMWLVDEAMRAWHAGDSLWDEEDDINSSSIGIELQNFGHTNGYREFPDIQIKALINLCSNIIDRNRILPYYVLAHSDIAPGRKKDPGELFPWDKLAKENIGLWHDVTDSDTIKAYETLQDRIEIKSLLTKYGYNPKTETKDLITAFQRHFEPEIFKAPDQVGIANVNTISRLISLIRQKEEKMPLSF